MIPTLIALIVLAVPVVLFVSLLLLARKLRDTTEQLQDLARRVESLEASGVEQRPTAGTPFRTQPEFSPAVEPLHKPPMRPEPTWSPPTERPWRATPEPPPVFASEPPVWPTEEREAIETPPLIATPLTESASVPPPLPSPAPAGAFDWEQFTGVKLFAWIGGLALFLAVAFFIKYAFERNLIRPEVRVAIGFLVGAGLLTGGVIVKKRELAVTSQTLCATGVLVLYAVTFACRAVYHFPFFGPTTTFLLMVLVTAAAFSLAVQLEALVVAILGMLGGFLTPVLLSTGQDTPVALFTYVALLDLGLIAIALKRRWQFLSALATVGTVLMQLGWAAKFFVAEKVFVAMGIFLGFDLLFLLGVVAALRLQRADDWFFGSAVAPPMLTLAFAFYLLSFETIALRPGVLFSFVLGADLCLLTMVLMRPALHPVHVTTGSAIFLLLGLWTGLRVGAPLLYWALGLYLGFAALHGIFPVVLTRLRPEARGSWLGNLFPAMGLLLVLIPLIKQVIPPLLVWPAVLLTDILAIGLAVVTASLGAIFLVLVLTIIATATWLSQAPTDLTILPGALTVIGGFAVLFILAGTLAGRKLLSGVAPSPNRHAPSPFDVQPDDLATQLPAASAILPFLLLIMLTTRLPLANPSPVFGLAMVLVGVLLGVALLAKADLLVPVSLGCALALQWTWHSTHFRPEAGAVALAWYLFFYAIYTLFPFLFRTRLAERILPWCVSALAGPLYFYLIHRTVQASFSNPYPGLLPALFAIPMLLALGEISRRFEPATPARLRLLAWFGASALFFITLIFPLQFERQWITIGWALEGLALVWLFRRLPHPGLRATGVVLLAVAFVRLALNPAVLGYHRSSSWPVLNWYLYAYGIVTICLMLGARLLAPPRHLVWNRSIPPLLYTLGTILAFLLVNIEIADYFTEGTTLTFQFHGNFARDMSYSIAWGLFALGLLSVGIWKRLPSARYAAIGLMGATLCKLFFHDLSRLAQLYRIGAFMAVAVILILASFLYQRFVASSREGAAQS